MRPQYEYRFIRLGEGWLGAKRNAKNEYQGIIETHARQVWRLVQVFAPPLGAYGVAKYIEIILEREVD